MTSIGLAHAYRLVPCGEKDEDSYHFNLLYGTTGELHAAIHQTTRQLLEEPLKQSQLGRAIYPSVCAGKGSNMEK